MGKEKNYHGKREWDISGNSFFKGKGKGKITLFPGILEITRIIEKIISFAIWDPNGIPKNWECSGLLISKQRKLNKDEYKATSYISFVQS